MLDINNNTPRKIICIDNSDNNWGNCDNMRQLGVLQGGIYSLVNVEIHSWHTKIELAEFPYKFFNSVHFDEIEEEEIKMSDVNDMITEKNLEEQLFKTQLQVNKLRNENAQVKIAFPELMNALINAMKEYNMPVHDADDMDYAIKSVRYDAKLDKVVYESEEVALDEFR